MSGLALIIVAIDRLVDDNKSRKPASQITFYYLQSILSHTNIWRWETSPIATVVCREVY